MILIVFLLSVLIAIEKDTLSSDRRFVSRLLPPQLCLVDFSVAEAVDVFYAVKPYVVGILHCLFSVQKWLSFSLLSGDKHLTVIESSGQYLDVVIIRKAKTSAAEGAHLAQISARSWIVASASALYLKSHRDIRAIKVA